MCTGRKASGLAVGMIHRKRWDPGFFVKVELSGSQLGIKRVSDIGMLACTHELRHCNIQTAPMNDRLSDFEHCRGSWAHRACAIHLLIHWKIPILSGEEGMYKACTK